MMKYFSSILSSLLLLTTAHARPQPHIDPNALIERTIQKMQDCERAGVYICKDVGFNGDCTHYNNCIGGAPSQCVVLDGQASAIGPDPGFTCNFYKTGNCDNIPGSSGGKLQLAYPGTGNLFNVQGENWNDAVRSYQCFKQ